MAKFGIALGSGPRGLGFESRHSDQKNPESAFVGFGFFFVLGFERLNATVWETVAADGLTEVHIYLRTFPCTDANESRHSDQKNPESSFVGFGFFFSEKIAFMVYKHQ